MATLRDRRALTSLIALATLVLVGCQSVGDGTIQPAGQVALPPATRFLAPDSTILNVFQTANSGEIILQFNPGTSAATASAAGHRYGLEMVGGPVISGPLLDGRFVFQIPQADVEAETPTTARVYFPTFIKSSDRAAYLVQHHLQLIRWVRGIDGVIVAEVRLPAAPLNPTLVDPVAGLFQVALPLGLELGPVTDWAKTLAMRVVSYDPASGATIVHPTAWRPVAPRPVTNYSRQPQYAVPPAAPAGTLYVQFTTGVSSDTIGALATKLGLGVTTIDATDLAVLSGDPATTRAAIQLLSDNPSVQCVGLSADPCATTSLPAAPTSVAPPRQAYFQPPTASVSLVNGVLELSWQSAAGATAYAIFSTSSPGGSYQLVAIVAGVERTTYAAFDQTAPGASVYYQVVALHPCMQSNDGGACDAAVVPFDGQGTAAAGWTNPATQQAPVVQQPAPSPSPSPAPAASTDPAASPSPAAPADPTAASAPPAPPVVVQEPQQTQLGPAPLDAPAGVNAAAADGHVTLDWQPVPMASSYRVYRSTAGGAAAYLATTSETEFVDTGGAAGTSYSYQVAGVAGTGLVGKASDPASATWEASTAAPVVLRSLPAEAGVISGTVRLQVDARSGDGRGQVQWKLSGPAANLTIGAAAGQPIATAPLSWSSALAWDTSTVPDGSYTVSAVVTGSSGQRATVTLTYRVQNSAPIAPVNLAAVSQPGGVAVSWQQAASEAGATYRLYRDQPVSGTMLVQLSADRRSFVDSGVTPGLHHYQLVLTDAEGRAGRPASAQVTVAAAALTQPQPAVAPDLQVLLPTGEALAAGGRVTDRLMLVAPAMSGLSFEISSDGRTWSTIQQTPTCSAGGCSADLSMGALASGAYSVRAVAAGQASPTHTFVRVDATRYGAPMAVTAQVTGLGVQLSWTAPPSALPTSYQVSRRAPGGDWKLLDQVTSTTFIDANAPAGSISEYEVSAVDPEGSVGTPSSPAAVSVPSIDLAELKGTGLPAAPANVQAIAAHGRAIVRWDRVSGSDGYLVERQLEPDGAFASAGTTSNETFVDAPAPAARNVSYRVTSLVGVVTGATSAIVTTLVIPVSAPAPISQAARSSDRPAAPSTVTATAQSGSVQLTWAAGAPAAGTATAPSATYSVYRLDPATGAFSLAASGIEASSFVDAALPPSARFGYVVTASSAGGLESVFSDPTWATAAPASQPLTVQFMAPTPAEASLIQAESLQALAKITAAAGVAQVSFALAPAGGLWNQLSAVPVDPRAPLPGPSTSAGPAALWGTTMNTTTLAPGSYKLRVQVRDQAGNSQEQVQDLFVAGTAARGPPAFALTANAIQGGVHLQWTAPNTATYLVQRSIFGPDGPLETVASVQAQQYDDLLAIPGHSYAYQVVELGSAATTSAIATASPLGGQAAPTDGGPSVSLGAVSQTELSTAIATAATAHQLTTGLQALGTAFDVNATSLATNQQVHHLGQQAQVTFVLPPGLTPEVAASAAIYHWDDSSGSWVQESSTVDSSLTSVTAPINHLSQFVVASAAHSSGNGTIAQPPAPPTDSGSQSTNPSLQTPSLAALQVAADGEVISLRTANSRLYKQADGSFQQTVSAEPMNYQDSTGAWQKIDNSLVSNGSASTGVHNAANSFHVDLPGTIGERGISISDGSAAISMTLEGAAASALVSSGNHASYAAALPGVDAGYDVIPNGLKESLTINHRSGHAPVFTFDLTTGSLILLQQPDGTVLAVDAAGKARFTINAPWMYDAAVTQTDNGTMSRQVAVTLTGGSGSYRLTYTPDEAWLNDPSRKYPVTLDPSFAVYGSGYEYDDQINTCSPGFNYHGYTYLPIGYTYYGSPCNNSHPSRAEVQFNNFLYDGYYASSATLYLYQYTNYGTQRGNPGTTIYATAPTVGWSYTGVTWNNQPGVTGAYASAKTLGGAGWVTWNVTSLVQAWETKALGNNGIMLYANAENGPYNNNEFFYGLNSGTGPELSITYDSYSYTSAVAIPTKNIVPSGGTTPVDVLLTNYGTAAWGTDTRLTYRWWSGGSVITTNSPNYTLFTYVPYTVPGCAQPCTSPTSIDLRVNLVAPQLASGATVYLQLALRNNTFWFSSLAWGSPSNSCDQFYYTALSCSTGTPITLANESATIAWQGQPQVVSAVAGSLLSIPLTLTNTSTTVGANYTWHAYDAADLIRVGIRDYRSTAGNVTPLSNLPNLRTYLLGDVAPQGTANVTAVIQAPGDPGDYLLRIDLVHDTSSTTTWFADQGNQPLEVRARIIAPGDDKTSQVPVSLGDGSALGINTSNGFAALMATDINIPERGSASLLVARTYNGVNGLISSLGTSATSSTYGVGWTFDFQRSLHLGSLGANTYDPSSGILTDAQGRAWALAWNAARGLYEDAAGNRTVTPTAATVVAAGGTLAVPTRPIDLLNGVGMVVQDGTAPGGYALRMDTPTPPTALIMPAGVVPTQQNGTVEFWFEPNFSMTPTAGCHVFFSDAQMRFGLAWNCTGQSWGGASQVMDFFTYDGDTGQYDILSSGTIAWTGGWHHIAITWGEGGAKQLMTDTTVVSDPTHAQSPIADLIFGYEANGIGAGLNYLNGRIAQLRVDGRVVPQAELNSDAAVGATVAATGNTLYLGHYDQGSVQSSSSGYTVRNPDQSIETYSSAGMLQSRADRLGNQVDYSWDAAGRIQSISDHSIPGRTITFTYNGSTFTATDFAGRSFRYQLNGSADLVSVTQSNQVPDPRTGVVSAVSATTSYTYTTGHLMQQMTDPRGAKTTVNYDQSYRQSVLIDNPTAYWRLGETSGTTAADSAGSYPASLHGGTTTGQGGALWGDSDLAYKFDGSTGYLSSNATVTGISNSLSLEAWVNHAGAAWSASHEMLLSLRSGNGVYLSVDAGNIFMSVFDGTNQRVLQGAAVPSSGWHHLVGTWDGSQMRVYIDGVLSATSPAYLEGSLYSAGTTMVGSYDGASYFFKGRLDEAVIYSGVLTSTRIQAHFIAGRLGVLANPTGYAAQVVLDDPVGYWRLGESAGVRAFDQSGYGNQGKASGGVSLGQNGALTNDNNTSTGFDGSSGYITTGAVGSLPRWTLEAWINPSAGQSTDAAVISDVYSTLINYVIFFNPTGSTPLGLVAGFYDAAGWHYTSPINVALGSWSHVAATYDGAVIRVYIDGTQVASLSYAASPTSNGLGLRIGRRWDTTNYFAGSIAEAAIYPTALSPARLSAHYNAGRATPIAGDAYPLSVNTDAPAGYWRLGETSGTSALDSSGSGHAGTYIGGVTLAQAGAVASDADYAAHFNGSNAYVSLGDSAAFQVNAGTIEAWINTTTTAQSAIAAKLAAWWFGVQTTGKLGFYDPTAAVIRDSGVIVNDGRWHHVAATFQSGVTGGSQMYVDGKAAGSPFLMTVTNQTNEVEIAGYAVGQLLNGSVDEVALYPSVLSAGRILSHYQATRLSAVPATGSAIGSYSANVAADGPVGFWRLDEPAGSTAQDRSGSNNTGTYSATGVAFGQPGALATDGDLTARFDGLAGYVSVPSSPSLNIAGPMTIEAWIQKPAAATGPIVEFNNGSAVGVHMWNYNTSDALYVNFVDTAGATHNIQSAAGLFALNTWYQVAAVYDGAYGSLYVNGGLVARTYLGSFTPQTSYALYIARRPSGSPNYYLNSGIADVAIYPYALPASRILAHYNASWDFTQNRVAGVQDARGNTIASFAYNESVATTQVIDGRGLPSYYTYQASGARTITNTDTGNNLTIYQYDSAAPYRLTATSSPTVLQHYTTMNTSAPVGQQGQILMQDDSGQPRPTSSYLMNGAYPDPSLYGASTLATTNESWIWDSTVTVQPGGLSHRSTPGVGTHQHYLTFGNALMVPVGSTVSQWVYLEPGTVAPSELELQFDAADSTGWGHRATWGSFGLLGAFGCPTYCSQSGSLPVAGRWVQLSVNLGPNEGASPQSDVDMAGRLMNGIAFTLYGGTGAVWWGPTLLTFPGASVADPSRAITRNAYNASNDLIASVDPNGIANVKDVDSTGLTWVSSTAAEPAPPIGLFQDNVSAIGTSAWQQEFGYAGTSALAVTSPQHGGLGSLTQTHSGPGLQSDLYKDVSGLSPGTYVRVSVWVQTSVGATGIGGASLMVENHLTGALNVQRRSANVQTGGQWMQLTLPVVVDSSGQLRIHLWHENLQGTTTWADLHIDDLTPAPDITLQHPLGVFVSSFEVQPDASWTLGTATVVNDSTQSHSGLYSIKDTLGANNTNNTVSHTVSLSTSATYRVSAWVRTVVSGGHGGSGGAQLCAQFTTAVCSPSTTTYVTSEGQWQQVTLSLTGSGTLTVQLKHANWQGDVFWDDVVVERVADAAPASGGTWLGTSWTGSVTAGNGAAATWASSWTGGIGGGPSRQVTISAPGLTTDIADTLATSALRTGSSYVISLWASSTVASSTITLSLSGQTLDFSPACVLQTTPTLCQNSFTYSGPDRGSNNLTIYYGGQGVRTVSISHPLVALAAVVPSYTQYGQPTGTWNIFGPQTRTDYDAESLYPIDTIQLMSASGQLGLPPAQPNYASEAMVDAPVAYWRLGDGGAAASAVDLSGGANTGAIVGGVARGAAGALPADTNSAMTFDGVSGYINAGDVSTARFSGLAPFTVETWVKPNAIAVNSWPRLVSKEQVSFPRQGWNLWINDAGSGGYVGFERWNNQSSDFVGTAAGSLRLGVWTDVVITWDGSVQRIYLNGVLSASAAGLQNIASNTYPLIIGATNGPQAFFNGSMQDIAIYPYALPAARVISQFQTGTASVPAPGAPSLLTSFVYNSVGQVVLSTRIAGTTRIADRKELDSWGRLVAETANYAPGVPADSQTNVRTGNAYDLNGHVTDSYTQGTQPGTWVDAHIDYDGNANIVDRIANYISGQPETASQNVTTRMTYDAMNELTDVATPLATAGGSTVTHTVFDTTGRQAQSIVNYVPGGPADFQTNVTTSTTYDSDGRTLTILKPLGSGQVPTRNTYDILGRLVRQVIGAGTAPTSFQAASAQTDWTFDAGGRITDVLGAGTGSPAVRYDTHYDLDDLGRPLAITEAYGCGSPCVPATSKTIYDPRGATTSYSPPTQQLAGGAATRTEVDLVGHVLRTVQDWQAGAGVASDLNVATTYTYDGFGRAVTVTDPRNVVSATTYDALDRHVSVTLDPTGLNLTKSSVYSLAGDLVQVITARDGGNRTDQSVFDPMHRQVTVYQNCVNCLTGGIHDYQTNVETDTSYDSLGHVLATTDALGLVARTDYDHLGRKVDQIQDCVPTTTCAGTPTFDQNVKTTWTLDSSGLTLAQLSPRTGGTDNINLTTAYGYDVLGRVVSVVDDKGAGSNGHLNLTTGYAYDPLGNLVSMTDPGSGTTTYTLDQFGQRVRVTDALTPTPNVVQTNYNLAGEVISIVNGRGKTNSFTLDRLGRVLSETYLKADNVTAGTVTFGYDASGNQTSFADSDVAITNVTFDNAGRINQVSSPAGTTSYTYFLDGAVRTVTDITGTTTFTEDQLGRIKTAKDPLEAGTTTYTVDALGQTTTRVEASGFTTNATYSGIGQLNAKTTTAGSQFASWTNQYDLAGNRVQEVSVLPGDTFAGTATFGYDTVQRLNAATQATQPTLNYGYDLASDRTSVSGGTAPRGSTGFTYLANNALSTETPTGGTQISYAPDADGNITRDAAGHYLHFDSLNRLEAIYDTTNATLLVSYTYDARGRLTTRTASGSTLTLVYRGITTDVVSESVGGVTLRNYAFDSSGRSLAVQVVGTGTFSLLTDPHGDVVALATGAGAIQGWIHYDAWGQVLGYGGTQIPFGYQDDFTDPVDGYARMGIRWYDPRQGRFVSSDPAALSGDTRSPLDRQLWLYALDSPLDFADPTGLSSCAWWDAVCKAKEAWNAATKAASDAWNAASKAASNAWNVAADWVRRGIDAAHWVGDRIADAVTFVKSVGKTIAARATSLSRQLRSGATAAIRSAAARALPGVGKLAKNPIFRGAEGMDPVMTIVGFGLTAIDNIANKHESPLEGIVRAGITTGTAALGGALGELACAGAIAGEAPTLGVDTPITIGVCLAGPTLGSFGGAWLGDRIGDALFSPQPTPSWQRCVGTGSKTQCYVTVPVH